MIDCSNAMAYSARASAELCAMKLEDDIKDSKNTKKLLCKAIFPFFKHFIKKSGLDTLRENARCKLDKLTRLEEERCSSLDRTAELFGELLGEVFSYGLDQSKKVLAYEIGFHTGKFIYAADAADDYQKDIKSGSYNPLAELFGDSFGDEQKNSIKTALLCELKQLEAAVNLVDFSSCPDIGEIIYNIIYLGMPEQMDRALYKSERTDNK